MKNFLVGAIGGIVGFLIYFIVLSHKGFDTYNEAIIYFAIWFTIAGILGGIASIIVHKLQKKKGNY